MTEPEFTNEELQAALDGLLTPEGRAMALDRERSALAAEYVDLIGYDPFEDDLGETVESVRQRLVEYKKAVAEEAAQ